MLRKKDNIVTRTIAGETLLVPLADRLADLPAMFALDEVAAFIWEKIDGTHTEAQICEAVVRNFDVGPEKAGRDVREFVRQLVDGGLVEDRGGDQVDGGLMEDRDRK